MKRVFLFWSALIIIVQGGLTDDAYRAYKKGEQSRAFELYNKAWQREESRKALYNIAVFYEKGIGVRKNLPKALEYYRRLAGLVDWESHQSKICRDPMLPWYRKALKKLIRYEGDKSYRYTLDTLNETCGAKAAKKGGFCTADGKVASRYRDWLGCLDCTVIRRHFETIRHFAALARKRESNDQHFRKTSDMKYYHAHDRINRQIEKTLAPVMKELTRKTIRCVRKAKTGSDLNRCYEEYRYCAESFLGCHIMVEHCPEDSRIPECVKEREWMRHRLSAKEREKAVRSLERSIRKGEYFDYQCPLL